MINLHHSVKAIAFAGFFSTALLLTGCFRIIEKVDFRSMQAGTYTMNIDLSTMNQLMKSSGQSEDTEETERELPGNGLEIFSLSTRI